MGVPAAKPGNLSSIPGIHLVEGANCPLTSTVTQICTINKYNFYCNSQWLFETRKLVAGSYDASEV